MLFLYSSLPLIAAISTSTTEIKASGVEKDAKNERTHKLLQHCFDQCTLCLMAREIIAHDNILLEVEISKHLQEISNNKKQVDSVIHDQCERLPGKYSSLCSKAAHILIESAQKSIERKTESCSSICDSNSSISTGLACDWIHQLQRSIKSNVGSISAKLLPQFCKNDRDPFKCAKKTGTVIHMLENPVNIILTKVVHAIDEENSCGLEKPNEEQEEKNWSRHDLICQSCISVLHLARYTLNHASLAGDIAEVLRVTLLAACERQISSDCDKLAGEVIQKLKEEEAQFTFCKMAFGCEEPE